MDFVKEELAPKSFTIAAYISAILQPFCGAIFSVITGDIRKGEKPKFVCSVDSNEDKAYIESSCFGMYDDLINGPLPLYGFVCLSFGLHAIVSIVYSLCVRSRVEEIEDSLKKNEDVENNKNVHELRERRSNRKGICVFNAYILYLVIRFLLGASCNVLQYSLLFPLKFPTTFHCNIHRDGTSSNSTRSYSISCNNLTASEKTTWGIVVFVANVLFAVMAIAEALFLLRKRYCFQETSFTCSEDFIIVYFLRKPGYLRSSGKPEEVALLQNSVYIVNLYKNQILGEVLPSGIFYGQSSICTNINATFVSLIIHTGRAKHVVSKEYRRHEIDDVYFKLPPHSIPLHQLEDLFKPNEDTKDKFPRTILVVGRPGIGKTVLCHKIKYDWADESDESSFYREKVVFFLKFRWFNIKCKKFSLKSFLRCGIQVDISSDQFDLLFKEISQYSEKAILMFDGLDESNENFDELINSNDQVSDDDEISPGGIFIKIVMGQLLPRATVLVTTRATADHIYSKLRFQRQVEVLGFTRDKIEEYVEKFCCNCDQSEKQEEIKNFIKSSSQIRNLCYVPVNCFIVCVTLLGCLLDSYGYDEPLPTTLTELYVAAVRHLQKYHNRSTPKHGYESKLFELEELAFHGVEMRQLLFDSSSLENKICNSGLLHRLSNPIFPAQAQYCFIHLTIQEFLAAQYVVERKTAGEICEFVESKLEDGKWRLVLQFVAGLLGEKMKLTKKYNCCVDAFTSGLRRLGSGMVGEREIAVLKCLNEFKKESAMKKAALECLTDQLWIGGMVFLVSDLAALGTFLKWAPQVRSLILRNLGNDESVLEIAKILGKRCFESLSFGHLRVKESTWLELFRALASSSCELSYQHCLLKKLEVLVSTFSDSGMMHLCEFLQSKCGRGLEELIISNCQITSRGVSTLCETLSGPKVGKLLRFLKFSNNDLGDEAVPFLCEIFRKKHVKLTDVSLRKCHLTSDSMSSLCRLLNEEHFQCTVLDLGANQLGDKAVKVLHDDLIKEQTEVEELNLSTCELSSECMPLVCSLLKEKFCNVVRVFLSSNEIGDKGAEILFRSLATKHLKLKKLHLTSCGLTDGCMPALCELLKDEHCNLEHMDISDNKITDTYIPQLCDVFRGRHFEPELTLRMAHNFISEQGKSSLRNIGANVEVLLSDRLPKAR